MNPPKCHCGSESIWLFQGYACKAECDLPLSMRSKPPLAFVESPAWCANEVVSFGGREYCLHTKVGLWWNAVRVSDGTKAAIEERFFKKVECQYWIGRLVSGHGMIGTVDFIDRTSKTLRVHWDPPVNTLQPFYWDSKDIKPL